MKSRTAESWAASSFWVAIEAAQGTQSFAAADRVVPVATAQSLHGGLDSAVAAAAPEVARLSPVAGPGWEVETAFWSSYALPQQLAASGSARRSTLETLCCWLPPPSQLGKGL